MPFHLPSALSALVLVVVASVTAAAFRVSTAPDRIRDRKNEARATCVAAGGDWVMQQDGREACQRDDGWKL